MNENAVLENENVEADVVEAETENEEQEVELTEQEKIDVAVKTRLAREQKKNEAAIVKAVAEARAEEQRLAQMSAEEREKELQKQYEQSLKEKEDKLALRENTADAKTLFASSGLQLSDELQAIVVTTDAEQTENNAKAVIAEITKQADALYERKAKQDLVKTQPKKSTVTPKTDEEKIGATLDELWNI